MRIEAIIYVHGPQTQWEGKVADSDIIARRAFPLVWAATLWARTTHKPLDPRRCGWAVLRDGEVVEQVEAQP